MTFISRKTSADKFVAGTVEHFIARECDACDRVKRTTRVVMVNSNEHHAIPAAGEPRVYATERFGVARRAFSLAHRIIRISRVRSRDKRSRIAAA